MSDRISIVGLEIYAHIGVPDEERSRRQKLLVNLDLKVRSVEEAAQTDNVALTVDYSQVANTIKAVAASRPRKLIETLAENIATAVFTYDRVKEATVVIEKFILPDTHHVSVEIRRKAPKRPKVKPAKVKLPVGRTPAPRRRLKVTPLKPPQI
jgi:dihydroneopterin aldolase